MILSSSNSQLHSPLAINNNNNATSTTIEQQNHQINSQQQQQPQLYHHKLNQVELRTISTNNKHSSNNLNIDANLNNDFNSSIYSNDQQHDGKRRRSRADSSHHRLSVILPANQQQQPIGSSLETPVAIHSQDTNNQQINHLNPLSAYQQTTTTANQPSSGCQLYNSLMQLAGQDRVGSFTGLPSCTPTSADALAASANLSPINPFFFNVSSYTTTNQLNNKQNCDNYVHQQHQQPQHQHQHQQDQQSLPEDLSPRTRARLATTNISSSTNHNNNSPMQLHVPAGTLMLSPFPFLLSPEHETWLRLNFQSQNQHPLAGKSAPKQMPVFDETLYCQNSQQQQQQQNSSINQKQQQSSDIGFISQQREESSSLSLSLSLSSSSSSRNLAQDLSNQQQLIGQQHQHQQQIKSSAIATTIDNDLQPISSTATEAAVAAAAAATSTQHNMIVGRKTTAQSSSSSSTTSTISKSTSTFTSTTTTPSLINAPISVSANNVSQLYESPINSNRVINHNYPSMGTTYMVFPNQQQYNHHHQHHHQHQQTLEASNNIISQQELAQKQIFIPVHQQQPLAQSHPIHHQPIQQFQQKPFDPTTIQAAGMQQQQVYLNGPHMRHNSYPQQQQQQQTAQIQSAPRYNSSPSLQQQQQHSQQSNPKPPESHETRSLAETIPSRVSTNSTIEVADVKNNMGSSETTKTKMTTTIESNDIVMTTEDHQVHESSSANGLNSSSNSSSAFNCSSPPSSSSSSGSDSVSGLNSNSNSNSSSISNSNSNSNSARSSISRDTLNSIDVVMASSNNNTNQSLKTNAQIHKNTGSKNSTKSFGTKKTTSKTAKISGNTKLDNPDSNIFVDSSLAAINGEIVPIKKKSKGGRKKKQVTHEEMLARKNRSKERNRVAAKRCRQKRKQFIDDLCAKIDNINDLNRKLQKENAQLKEELDRLKKKQH